MLYPAELRGPEKRPADDASIGILKCRVACLDERCTWRKALCRAFREGSAGCPARGRAIYAFSV